MSDDPFELVARLHFALLNMDAPERIALMQPPSSSCKYKDIRQADAQRFRSMLHEHCFGNGDVSIAASLQRTVAGKRVACAACRDYDAGGEAILRQALVAAQAMGLTAFAVFVPARNDEPGDNDGGHVWAFFRENESAERLRAVLSALPGEKGEIYPSGNSIRLPFGFHRRKRTRGRLMLQDGRSFDLDDEQERRAALATIVALPLNDEETVRRILAQLPRKPAAAPQLNAATEPRKRLKPVSSFECGGDDGESPALRRSDASFGERLMRSRRFRRLAAAIPQLQQALRGEAQLMRDGAPDASRSAQVACVAYHLMRAHYPREEARAIMIALHPRLRPNRPFDHYLRHIEREFDRYQPRNYRPRPTMLGSDARIARRRRMLRALTATPRPVDQYLAWLQRTARDGVVALAQRARAAQYGKSQRTVRRYEAELERRGVIRRAQNVDGASILIVKSAQGADSRIKKHSAPRAPRRRRSTWFLGFLSRAVIARARARKESYARAGTGKESEGISRMAFARGREIGARSNLAEESRADLWAVSAHHPAVRGGAAGGRTYFRSKGDGPRNVRRSARSPPQAGGAQDVAAG